ncbi:HEAT repeat domain-containing protein [Rudaea sp.]|uniref:HEAT repeat domain-containing protein n=1 Tax=Rudaea sp. TaxID=2136325 RepID=UPI0037835276
MTSSVTSCLSADLEELATSINSVYDSARPDTFWELESLFHSFVRSGGITRAFNANLREMLAHPLRPSSKWHVDQITLIEGHFGLYIGKAIPGSHQEDCINTSASNAMVIPMGGAIDVKYFKAPKNWRPDVYNEEPLVFEKQATFADGQVIKLHAGRDIFHLTVEKPICLVKLVSLPSEMFTWSYDVQKLTPFQMASTLGNDDMLKTAFLFSAEAGWADLTDSILPFTKHSNHSVRWEAMKAIARLSDTEVVRKLLENLANDPHPHIRKAAQNSLQKIR